MQLDILTLFAGVTHASLSVSPGTDEARKMTVTSGRKLQGSWMPSGPLGDCLKTLLDTSIWASTKCFLNWKAKATPHGRLLFQLAPSMPRTEETGSGLWRTPDTGQGGTVSEEVLGEMANGQMTRDSGHQRQLRLQDQVRHQKLWPTPIADDAKNITPNPKRFAGQLYEAVYQGPESGSLNPTWVEWLMGFPEGWTDLKD